jgi:hypothetical protein
MTAFVFSGTIKAVMRKYLSLILTLLTVCLTWPMVGRAETAGQLIKTASNPAVYYVENGLRYAFPNESVFFSWYDDFLDVQTTSDIQLASNTLTQNVTYRPGTLVKITTDPKVYVVGRHGVLRWIMAEALAKRIFGAEWNKQVNDVADVFFINYKIGDPIDAEEDYDLEAELAVMDIHQTLYRVPILRLISQPSPYQAHMRLIPPLGEDVSWTVIVEGTKATDPLLAICVEPLCSLIVEIKQAQNFTAFTLVGDQVVGSNNLMVRPLIKSD